MDEGPMTSRRARGDTEQVTGAGAVRSHQYHVPLSRPGFLSCTLGSRPPPDKRDRTINPIRAPYLPRGGPQTSGDLYENNQSGAGPEAALALNGSTPRRPSATASCSWYILRVNGSKSSQCKVTESETRRVTWLKVSGEVKVLSSSVKAGFLQ